jgi:hypothetical protein
MLLTGITEPRAAVAAGLAEGAVGVAGDALTGGIRGGDDGAEVVGVEPAFLGGAGAGVGDDGLVDAGAVDVAGGEIAGGVVLGDQADAVVEQLGDGAVEVGAGEAAGGVVAEAGSAPLVR